MKALLAPQTKYLAMAMILAGGIFILDLILPAGIAVWAYYLLPAFIMYQWAHGKHLYLVTLVCTVLVLVGLLVSPPATSLAFGLVNRIAQIIVLWLFAFLLVHRARIDEQLRIHQEGLEEQIRVRTAALKLEIAERERMQVALSESEELFRLMSDISPAPKILSRVTDSTILYANPAAVESLGWMQPEVIGRKVTEFYQWSEDRRVLLEQIDLTGVARNIELAFKRTNGDIYWSLFSAARGMYHGEPVILAIGLDITERKRMEAALRSLNGELEQRVAERTCELTAAMKELKRLSQMKDEFMSAVSHELRTPLSGILALSETLELQTSDPLTPYQVRKVRLIRQSGDRLLSLINGILDYTNLLAGRTSIVSQRCKLAEICALSAYAVKDRLADKQQILELVTDPEQLTITSDPTALRETLIRLLDNAAKFTPPGGRIGLEAHEGASQDTIELVVWDTGIGIPADQMQNIYAPFMQGDGGLSRGYDGIGLGLAYVRQAVELLRGVIRVESTAEQGSRFIITLPAG